MLVYSIYVGGLTGNPLAWLTDKSDGGGNIRASPRLPLTATIWCHNSASKICDDPPDRGPQRARRAFRAGHGVAVARRLGLAYAVFILISIPPPLAQGDSCEAGDPGRCGL